MFTQRKIPNSFNECIEQDNTSKKLNEWADRVNSLGTGLAVLTAVGGLIIAFVNSSVTESYGYYGTETYILWGTFFTTILQYAIYVIMEIVIYNVCCYILRGLADIVYNTKISTDLEILNHKTSSEVITNDDANDNKETNNTKSKQKQQDIIVEENNYTTIKKENDDNSVVHVHEYHNK